VVDERIGGLVRRIRRENDLSQRQLGRRCGVSQSVVARVESGQRDLTVGQLLRFAALGGLRIALLAPDGNELLPMDPDGARDAGGSRLPAHLDTRHGDEGWWHDAHRYSRRRPEYTFDRDRAVRDEHRLAAVPADHHVPGPGDSLAERRAARQEEARRRARDRHHAAQQARLAAGSQSEPDWGTGCTCPAGCEFDADRNPDLGHAPDCACGCDVG